MMSTSSDFESHVTAYRGFLRGLPRRGRHLPRSRFCFLRHSCFEIYARQIHPTIFHLVSLSHHDMHDKQTQLERTL